MDTEFKELCRLCLKRESPNCVLHSIFDSNIPKQLRFCTTIIVDDDDNISTKICSSCSVLIGHFYRFRNTCLRNNKTLIKRYQISLCGDAEVNVNVIEDNDDEENEIYKTFDCFICKMFNSESRELLTEHIENTHKNNKSLVSKEKIVVKQELIDLEELPLKTGTVVIDDVSNTSYFIEAVIVNQHPSKENDYQEARELNREQPVLIDIKKESVCNNIVKAELIIPEDETEEVEQELIYPSDFKSEIEVENYVAKSYSIQSLDQPLSKENDYQEARELNREQPVLKDIKEEPVCNNIVKAELIIPEDETVEVEQELIYPENIAEFKSEIEVEDYVANTSYSIQSLDQPSSTEMDCSPSDAKYISDRKIAKFLREHSKLLPDFIKKHKSLRMVQRGKRMLSTLINQQHKLEFMVCPYCREKTRKRQKVQLYHIVRSHTSKLCKELNVPVPAYSADEDETNICPFCNKVFKDYNVLQRHVKIHEMMI